jgi:hypothetical protein
MKVTASRQMHRRGHDEKLLSPTSWLDSDQDLKPLGMKVTASRQMHRRGHDEKLLSPTKAWVPLETTVYTGCGKLATFLVASFPHPQLECSSLVSHGAKETDQYCRQL